MGASTSKIEEDKSLWLCSERKKFVKQALDGRCSLAASHVNYIQSLRSVGVALRKFVEPDPPTESSLCTSTSATPEPLALNDKSPSQFSFCSPSFSHPVDAAVNLSPSPSRFQVNQMKFRGSFSKTVEEKPSVSVMGMVMPSSVPRDTAHGELLEGSSFEAVPNEQGNAPWDYFFPPSENQFSVPEGEGIAELGEGEDKSSPSSGEESSESEDDEFDEPSADTLVRSFENLNRASDNVKPTTADEKNVALDSEILNHKKQRSPNSSPLQAAASVVSVSSNTNGTPFKEYVAESKVGPEDFVSTMKDIQNLFIDASVSGKEVPRMLEANKLHFRPIVPGTEGGSVASKILKACFSCGEDLSNVPKEPDEAATKYLTWHRATLSPSSSLRMFIGSNSKDVMEDPNNPLLDNFCMISGSHASTLDRLYAWERKLYDEVKGSKMIRRQYDMKCRTLRELESKGESPHKIDKTRAVIKDLHSRIRVAIHRIDHISNKIEELRDKELQPQLEELIKGLTEMWEEMSRCHEQQYNAISIACSNGNTRISIHSESRRQITAQLENELSMLSSSFAKWTGAQKSYFQAINGWLLKCILLPQKPKKKPQDAAWKRFGPPIYITCDVWLAMIGGLPSKDVVDSIKGLAAETAGFVPRHEKDVGKSARLNDIGSSVLRDEALEDWTIGFDHFRSSLVGFLGQLNNFAKSSAGKYEVLGREIQKAKDYYLRAQSFATSTKNSDAKGDGEAGDSEVKENG